MTRANPFLAIALTLGVACSQPPGGDPGVQPPPIEYAAGEGTWEQVPPSPLSPRYGARAVELDGDLLVFGGTDAPPCPPNADCSTPTEAPFRDGARYEPDSATWQEISEAPVPLGYSSTAVLGERVYVLVTGHDSTHPSVRRAFLSYDGSDDRWREHDLPPHRDWFFLTAAGDSIVAFQESQERGIKGDFVFDPASDSWSELAPDPLRPTFDRWMTSTPEGIVLTGIELIRDREPDEPNFYRAAILRAGRWELLPDSEIIGWNPQWSFTGGSVLNASTESADGGEVNGWDRSYPAGGTLDPSTEEWEELPNVPKQRGEFSLFAAGERYATAYTGWVYNAVEKRWLALGFPPDGERHEIGASFVDDALFVFGGIRWKGSDAEILDSTWMWTP